jgi:hypothetical protein
MSVEVSPDLTQPQSDEERQRSKDKEKLSNRVSIAAIALTMLMSFLGFARSERDDAGRQARTAADKAKRDSEANWVLYQTKSAERASFLLAEDALTREAAALPDGDPRVRAASLNHVEYAQRITAIDNQTRQIFFVIQDLDTRYIQKTREAEHIDRKIEQYDMGTRVLTLALVILSVTLLASQAKLFWAAVAIAFVGAGIAISGYFLF